jgi:hypothetical protein
MKTYYQANRAKILAKKKQYQDNNVDSIKEYQRLYYLKNKELKKSKVKERYLLKKDEIIQSEVAKRRSRREIDPFFKMKHNIRSLISMVLRNRSFIKESKTAILLGCSYIEFSAHIESLFDLSMSWDNYGYLWTYDHICPCAQAQTEEELVKLQHYSNLRPYKDNLVKSNNKTPEGEQLCFLLLGRKWRE